MSALRHHRHHVQTSHSGITYRKTETGITYRQRHTQTRLGPESKKAYVDRVGVKGTCVDGGNVWTGAKEACEDLGGRNHLRIKPAKLVTISFHRTLPNPTQQFATRRISPWPFTHQTRQQRLTSRISTWRCAVVGPTTHRPPKRTRVTDGPSATSIVPSRCHGVVTSSRLTVGQWSATYCGSSGPMDGGRIQR